MARLAGVSQSAVSRTFTPGASVSPVMREKVVAAAAALGYQPNLIPRIMATGRSEIIAVAAGGFYNPYFTDILEVLVQMLRDAGKQMMLVHTESDLALDGVVSELARYRVDAVVTPLSIRSRSVADALNALRIPIVTLNAGVTGGLIRAVISDSETASARAAQLLCRAGGTRFGYIGGPESPQQNLREQGFARQLSIRGVHEYARAIGNFDYDGGYRAALQLFEQGRPDAIYCMNDLAALGAMDAIRSRLGLRIPEDVLIMGYDNIAMSQWPTYDLSTFDQDKPAIVRAVLAQLGETAPQLAPIRIPASLIERRTTSRSTEVA
ncbi:LacI family DNA-binding transcriptional regulator [Sphingomonas abietis]|uniref:LacI family DNA-binding transcriptional regulator n=1 Tax=Sphingomonas abietis TaxID=3012344 RepID=A0ABY7NSN4_9SPHN|nr:LacI family DNA-binding transcriptional regulator [Sphingomonas abietis]WBO23805.1 LacI family DNA-binding transcriptional regulator [Sphingomonas abietis]